MRQTFRFGFVQVTKSNHNTIKDKIIKAIEETSLFKMNRAMINFYWVERNLERKPIDISNVCRSLIMKSLVETGILESDGLDHVIGFKDTFVKSAKEPGVIVYLDDYVVITESKKNKVSPAGGI